jgi:hypothetical protein
MRMGWEWGWGGWWWWLLLLGWSEHVQENTWSLHVKHIKCRGSCRFSQWRWLLGTAASVAGVVALSIQAAGPVVRNGSRFQTSWEYQLEAVLNLRCHQVSPCLDYTGVNHVKSSSQ